MGFTSSYSSVNADRPPNSATSLFGKSSQSFSSSFGGSPYSQTASMDFTFGTPHDKDSLFKASVAERHSSSEGSSSGFLSDEEVLSTIDDQVLHYISEAQKSQSHIVIEQVITDESCAPVKNTTGIFVPSCTDRSFWDSYTMPKSFIQAVQYFMKTPIPDRSDEAYLDYRKTGQRLRGQAMLWARQVRLPYLVLAECKFNNGTFLEAVESTLVALSTQRSWAYPVADYDLKYFYGEMYFMDLSSASISENIGLALHLLDDSLSSSTGMSLLMLLTFAYSNH